MRAIVQRCGRSSVAVDGQTVGAIDQGLVVLVAAHRDDTESNAHKLASKLWNLRIFSDADGKMNLSLAQLTERDGIGAWKMLAISNFTVLGDTEGNRRPSFVLAAPYDAGERLFETFVAAVRSLGCEVETGVFGADMAVSIVNVGPVTVIVDG